MTTTPKPPAPPKLIGHRGVAAYAPENTIAGIHAAADMGLEWVYLDVKITQDGVAVLFADDLLTRTTGAGGALGDTSRAAVGELDAGSWFGESFINERVPTLEDALDVVNSRGLYPVLVLRPSPGHEIDTAEAALDAATRIWPEDEAPPMIVSASNVSLETCRDMLPEWPRGLLIEEYSENWPEVCDYLEITSLHLADNNLSRDGVEEYVESQLPIIAHVVNDARRAQDLLRWGVDSLVTDQPDVVRESIERFH